jgi:OOP family OmpA-OmpF porin
VDPDPDKDGFLGDADACPLQAETKNGWKDTDGCPDERLAELTGIGFELDSAKIDITSAPLLERAYEILHANPTISIEIAGHTSSDGDANRNQLLSLQRAEAVKKYLVGRGIDGGRLLTVGHGSDEPVADNRTDEGRKQNRRIEFRILVPSDMP